MVVKNPAPPREFRRVAKEPVGTIEGASRMDGGGAFFTSSGFTRRQGRPWPYEGRFHLRRPGRPSLCSRQRKARHTRLEPTTPGFSWSLPRSVVVCGLRVDQSSSMRGLEILANQVAAGCMHAKFPSFEPRRGERFLTEETALADWSRGVADNGFHRSPALLTERRQAQHRPLQRLCGRRRRRW
jgi:hypothetical protein